MVKSQKDKIAKAIEMPCFGLAVFAPMDSGEVVAQVAIYKASKNAAITHCVLRCYQLDSAMSHGSANYIAGNAVCDAIDNHLELDVNCIDLGQSLYTVCKQLQPQLERILKSQLILTEVL